VTNAVDPLPILRSLHEHRVAFLIIGGMVATLHGSPSLTVDLDICYDRGRSNLEALAEVLQALHARLRGAPPDIPFRLDAQTLASCDHFTFSTDAGPLDCLGTPTGTEGYADLIRNAVTFEIVGLPTAVTGMDDLIRMKGAAGRPKDRIEIEILGALRDEVDREDH
jgi:hypothetical protein